MLNDVQIKLVVLNSTLFPGADGTTPRLIPSEPISAILLAVTQEISGYTMAFRRPLSGVQAALASTDVNKVLVTGHSLGAAVAIMDALLLKQNFDPSVEITITLFGLQTPHGLISSTPPYVPPPHFPTNSLFS